MNEPVQMVSKRVKWTSRVGQISKGLPNIPAGSKYYYGYQRGSGKNKHSGPSGKRAFRFHQGPKRH